MPDGIDVRFLEQVADRMNLKVEYILLPFKRGLSMLKTGEIDLMFGVLKRKEREEYGYFISPPYKTESSKAFYVLTGKESTITKHEDLRSFTIGTQLGAKYYPEFDNDRIIKKAPVKSVEFNIKMLLAGRIDAYVMTESSGDFRVVEYEQQNHISKAKFAYRKMQEVYMVLSKRSRYASRITEFNEVMRRLIEHGTHKRIQEQFMAELMN